VTGEGACDTNAACYATRAESVPLPGTAAIAGLVFRAQCSTTSAFTRVFGALWLRVAPRPGTRAVLAANIVVSACRPPPWS